MDVLADILAASNITASLYFRAELGESFAILVPEEQRYVRFHLASRSKGWIGLPSGESTYFSEGELVLVPHGSAHILANGPDSTAIPLDDFLTQADTSRVGCVQYGEDAGAIELTCGHFGFNVSLVHPILSTLPELIHVNPSNGRGFEWLNPLLSTMQHESRDGRVGHEDLLQRLSEVIFIQILRTYLEDQPDSTIALTALIDTELGPVLEAIHNDPGYSWSLERMAEVAGLSRTVFAERFRLKVSTTPRRYLNDWRMQKAKALLLSSKLTISGIGKSVSYGSDAAFSRAFKEYFGVSPAEYRRSYSSPGMEPAALLGTMGTHENLARPRTSGN